MGILEDAPGAVESVEKRCPPPGALSPVQPLPRGEGMGPLAQVLGAKQLTSDGTGEQILACVGTAGDEASSDAGRLDRSDGANPGWVTDAV
jgi:hypothetical protein